MNKPSNSYDSLDEEHSDDDDKTVGQKRKRKSKQTVGQNDIEAIKAPSRIPTISGIKNQSAK